MIFTFYCIGVIYKQHLTEFFLNKKEPSRKFSCELLVYESVDDRKPILGYMSRIHRKQNSSNKGLNATIDYHFLL